MCGFHETATTDGYFDEFRVEFGGKKTRDHVGDFCNKVRFKGVTRSEGFSREAMSKTRENHSDGVIGREREVRDGDVGFEFINDGGEDRVRETVKGTPLSVTEGRFE